MRQSIDNRPFVGRRDELARLERLAAAARAGEPRVALVSGEAGLGKTRLVSEFARAEENNGGFVLFGGSPPVVGPDLPFAPVAQMLRGFQRMHPAELLTDSGHTDLLMGLASQSGRAPQEAVGPSLTALAEQFLSLVVRLAAARPLLIIVIEDLHWADSSTLDLLGYLARNLRDDRVLTIATFRDASDLPARTAGLVTELQRAGAERLALAPLPASDIVTHIANIAGSDLSPDVVQKAVRLADGNPFVAEELALGALHGTGFPRTVHEMTRAILERLPEEALQVLRVASVAGHPVRASLLWHAAGVPENVCGTAIRRLTADRIMAPIDAPPGDLLVVRQMLIREAVYEELLEPERARCHAAIARTLASMPELGTGSQVETIIETAVHWKAAGDAVRAFPALVRAAEAAENVYAFREADALYRAALDLADAFGGRHQDSAPRIGFRKPGPEQDEMAALRRKAADAASLAGDPRRAAELTEQALSRSGDAADPSLLAALGRYQLEAGAGGASVEAFTRALEVVTDPELRVRIGVGRARALLASGRAAEALDAAEAARTASDISGRPSDRYQAMTVLALAQARAGAYDDAVETLADARRMTDRDRSASVIRPRPSRVLDLMATFDDAASLLRDAGRRNEAMDAAQEGAARAARLGVDASAGRLRVAAAENLFEAGRWGEAVAACDAVIQADPNAMSALILRARVLAHRGVWERAASDLARAESGASAGGDAATSAAFHAVLAELRYWHRQPADAGTSLETALVAVQDGSGARVRMELCELGARIAAERSVEARALGARVEQRSLAESAAAFVAELAGLASGAGVRGQALLLAAQAELSRTEKGDHAAWQQSLDAWTVLDEPFRAAYAQFRLAEAILSSRGSRAPASTLLQQALATAFSLEAAPLQQEIRLLGQRARVDVERRAVAATGGVEPGPSPGSDNPHGLSKREMEVLQLVAAGRTNRQIADELFITEKTAGHHVSNILGKLGVSNRIEAAGVAYRAGLAVPSEPPQT